MDGPLVGEFDRESQDCVLAFVRLGNRDYRARLAITAKYELSLLAGGLLVERSKQEFHAKTQRRKDRAAKRRRQGKAKDPKARDFAASCLAGFALAPLCLRLCALSLRLCLCAFASLRETLAQENETLRSCTIGCFAFDAIQVERRKPPFLT
jgi:hypothetical protein